MKKLGITLLALSMVCFLVIGVDAAPVGNIAKPAMLKSAMNPDGDSEVGLLVEGEYDYREDDDGDAKAELTTFEGKLGVVLDDKYIIYGLLGSAKYEEEFTSLGSNVRAETEDTMVYGFGATLMFYETELENSTLRVGMDGKWRTVDFDVEKVVIDGVSYSIPSGSVTALSLELTEWQFAVATSLEWQKLVPYVGVKYSSVEGTSSMTVSGTTYENSDDEGDVGIFVGCDVLVLDSMSINIEGRFIDEEAVTFGIAYRF